MNTQTGYSDHKGRSPFYHIRSHTCRTSGYLSTKSPDRSPDQNVFVPSDGAGHLVRGLAKYAELF